MTLVFFIGGCTYAEISAFRYLSESNESMICLIFSLVINIIKLVKTKSDFKGPSEFIIATTCITNGKSLISSLDP
jgi:hypothetical protein